MGKTFHENVYTLISNAEQLQNEHSKTDANTANKL